MKKALVIALFALLMTSVMFAAGCGDSNGGNADKDGTTVTGPMDSGEEELGGGEEYSVLGIYESAEGAFITLEANGTFTTDDWEDMTQGTYMSYQDDDGSYWVDLTFKDGTLVVLSVMIAMDDVAALVDDFTLVQYTKK